MHIFAYVVALVAVSAMELEYTHDDLVFDPVIDEQWARSPSESTSLSTEAMQSVSPDQMNDFSSSTAYWDFALEPAQKDQSDFIATIVDLLSAAADSKVLEISREALKALSESEKKDFVGQLVKKLENRVGQSLGNPLLDNEYRRQPKAVRHFHLAGPLIIAELPRFTERYLKAEFWRILKWCKEYDIELKELSNVLEPLKIYAAEFAKEGEKFGKILKAALEFLGKDTLSEYQADSVEAIYSELVGFMPKKNSHYFFDQDVFLTSLRLGVPMQVVIQKVNSLPTKPSYLIEWIHLALNQDNIKLDKVTDEMKHFLREFAVVSATFKEPAIDYLKLKRPEVIRALFGAIWDSTENYEFPAVSSQFVRMMETMGYVLDDGQFKDTLIGIIPGPILYLRLGNSPIKILLFYMMVKVLRMEVAVWPLIQTQNRFLVQVSPSPFAYYGPIFEAIPEALEYYDSCHRSLQQSKS